MKNHFKPFLAGCVCLHLLSVFALAQTQDSSSGDELLKTCRPIINARTSVKNGVSTDLSSLDYAKTTFNKLKKENKLKIVQQDAGSDKQISVDLLFGLNSIEGDASAEGLELTQETNDDLEKLFRNKLPYNEFKKKYELEQSLENNDFSGPYNDCIKALTHAGHTFSQVTPIMFVDPIYTERKHELSQVDVRLFIGLPEDKVIQSTARIVNSFPNGWTCHKGNRIVTTGFNLSTAQEHLFSCTPDKAKFDSANPPSKLHLAFNVSDTADIDGRNSNSVTLPLFPNDAYSWENLVHENTKIKTANKILMVNKTSINQAFAKYRSEYAIRRLVYGHDPEEVDSNGASGIALSTENPTKSIQFSDLKPGEEVFDTEVVGCSDNCKDMSKFKDVKAKRDSNGNWILRGTLNIRPGESGTTRYLVVGKVK